MKTLNYNQTLNTVEAFMDTSGIRDYCSNICKGHCCNKCYTTKWACHLNEGRRLACSIYMCDTLTKNIRKAKREIIDAIRYVSGRFADIYYYIPPKNLFTDLRVSAKITKLLSLEHAEEVNDLINLIKLRKTGRKGRLLKFTYFKCNKIKAGNWRVEDI